MVGFDDGFGVPFPFGVGDFFDGAEVGLAVGGAECTAVGVEDGAFSNR